MAFRFSAVDLLREPPTIATAKGTLVHRALELLFERYPAGQRDVALMPGLVADAVPEVLDNDENQTLALTPISRDRMIAEAEQLATNYFKLEDPNLINAIGLELKMDVKIGDLTVRGIIDRLDRREDGALIVVDYKTGKPPRAQDESAKMAGVHMYALMCEQAFGQLPAEVHLLHLKEPLRITQVPTPQSSTKVAKTAEALWKTIVRACENDDFRPSPSRLCDWCVFQQWCPSFGGDPSRAAAEYDITTASRAVDRR
jgi:putative RecB family exonuclease